MADAIDFAALEKTSASPVANDAPIDFGALEGSSAASVQQSGPSGVVANVGAGLNESIADTAGLPVDLLTGATNLIGRGINRVAGTSIAPIENPVGGSESIKRGMGLIGANPDRVAAATPVEQGARAVGRGVGSMVIPGVGAEAALGSEAIQNPVMQGVLKALRGSEAAPETVSQTALNVAKNAGIGAASGLGQSAGEAVAPDEYKPLVGTAGALIGGGLPISGGAALRWAFSHPSVQSVAADTVLANASDPSAFKSSVNNPAPDVPGVVSTPGKITNDAGVLQQENWARNQNPALFQRSAEADNAARVNAIPTFDSGQSPGQTFVNHLQRMDAAQKAVEDAATLHASDATGSLGAGQNPEDIGSTARGEVTANYTPQMQAAEAGTQKAETNLSTLVGDLGGHDIPLDGADTQVQARGAQLRDFVQQGKDARSEIENRLWTAARQNGDLQFDHAPVQEAVQEAVGRINPAGGDKLTPVEQHLYGTINDWNGPQSFDTIKAMRTNIGDAVNTAFRTGDSQSARRMLGVRDGLDTAIESTIDNRSAAEDAAVKAGQLDPNRTIGSSLADEAAAWKANRSQRPTPSQGVSGSGNAGVQPQRETPIPGPSGATGATSEEPNVSSGSPGLAPKQPVGDTAERYAAARAYTRETHGIFDDKPAGAVTARGPYGAPEKLPDSQVVRQFLNGKATEPDAVRNFEAATGGHVEAVSALQGAAMADLRASAVDNGRINPTKLVGWLKSHDGILSAYPELRQRIGSVKDAQTRLNEMQASRDDLTKRYQAAIGDSDATVMGRYFKPGPQGADTMDAYARETGDTPAARDAMAAHIANEMTNTVMRSGVWSDSAYRSWMAQRQAALSRRPDLVTRIDTAAKAQAELAKAQTNRFDANKALENGAAKHWLRTDPVTAVTNALSPRAGNNRVRNIRDLVALAKGDLAAENGVKSALRDWIVSRGISDKEAGSTTWIKNQPMRDAIQKNRAALAQAFTPDEMKSFDLLASSLRTADRSVTGSKPPIGPGTARDIAAAGKYDKGPSLLSLIGNGALKMGTMVAGHHLAGAEGMIGSAFGSDILHGLMSSSAKPRQEAIKNLMIEALNDPGAMRTLLAHATPENVPTLVQNLSRRVAQTTFAASQRYAKP